MNIFLLIRDLKYNSYCYDGDILKSFKPSKRLPNLFPMLNSRNEWLSLQPTLAPMKFLLKFDEI